MKEVYQSLLSILNKQENMSEIQREERQTLLDTLDGIKQELKRLRKMEKKRIVKVENLLTKIESVRGTQPQK